MNPLKPTKILEDPDVRKRLQSIVETLAQQSVNYLDRTDQLYHRVPKQLRGELEQVGWVAVCQWCEHQDELGFIKETPIGSEWSDGRTEPLCEHIRSQMNGWLFKDKMSRWIELWQDEASQKLINGIERGQL